MAKWGNCDYKQLQQLRENIAHLQGIDMDKFCKDMSKELARKLLQLCNGQDPPSAHGQGKSGRNFTPGLDSKISR